MALPATSDSPATIRLFSQSDGPSRAELDDPEGVHSGCTLPELFDRWCWPRWRIRSAPRGEEAFRDALKHWSAAVGPIKLREVDDLTSLRLEQYFAEAINPRSGKPLSPNTIIKHTQALQQILDAAGPTHDRKRPTARLLQETPWLARPEKRAKPPVDDFALSEIDAMIAAAADMTSPELARWPECPTWYTPPLLWSTLPPLLYVTGLRIGVTMLLEWEWIAGDVIKIPPVIRDGVWSKKGRKAEEIPLNRTALTVLAKLRQPGHGRRVFAWPFADRKPLYNAFKQLQRAAGIAAERQFGFHGFRKSHYNAVCIIDPLAASPALGHSGHAVGLASYKNPQRVREAKDKIQQPQLADEQQLRLF